MKFVWQKTKNSGFALGECSKIIPEKISVIKLPWGLERPTIVVEYVGYDVLETGFCGVSDARQWIRDSGSGLLQNEEKPGYIRVLRRYKNGAGVLYHPEHPGPVLRVSWRFVVRGFFEREMLPWFVRQLVDYYPRTIERVLADLEELNRCQQQWDREEAERQKKLPGGCSVFSPAATFAAIVGSQQNIY